MTAKKPAFTHLKRLAAALSAAVLLAGCANTAYEPTETSSPDTQAQITDIQTAQSSSTSELSLPDVTEAVTESPETTAPAADTEPTDESKTSEDAAPSKLLADLLEDERYSGRNGRFSDVTLAGYSIGEFITTDDPTSLYEQRKAIDNNIRREVKVIRPNTELIPNTLTVTAAGCEAGYDYINNQYLYCSGEITLSGILRYRKQNHPLGTEIRAKGDIFFYPYPSDIADLPLILSWGYFSPAMIDDDENGFYMLSDSIELLLGNTETKTIYTRITEIRDAELPTADLRYNEEIEKYLSDSEYYLATLTFTDLFLLNYQCRMTGYPFSSGNVSEIKSVEVMPLPSR